MGEELKARVIKSGRAEGTALVSEEPISFFGCMDMETGAVTEKGHPLNGKSVKGKVLVFPYGKGSTVGSYALYRLKKNKSAPAGIINSECEPIIAVGAIISEIPCVDKVPIERIRTGDRIIIKGDKVIIGNTE